MDVFFMDSYRGWYCVDSSHWSVMSWKRFRDRGRSRGRSMVNFLFLGFDNF